MIIIIILKKNVKFIFHYEVHKNYYEYFYENF